MVPVRVVVDLCELVVDSVVSWASSGWEVAVSQLEQQPHGASIQWGPACRTGGFGPRVPGSMCEVSGFFFFCCGWCGWCLLTVLFRPVPVVVCPCSGVLCRGGSALGS